MKFLVKNAGGEVVADFNEEFEADEFVDAHGSFGLTVEVDLDDCVERLREVLENRVAWTKEYSEEHGDYASGAFHIVDEMSHDWARCIEDWLDDNYDGSADREELAQRMSELMDSYDCEAEPNRSDYGGYSGSGCCLWGFKIEETEDQISLSDCEVCSELDSYGILDDCLDKLEDDFYINRSRRRENQGTKEKPCYREVGRKLVNPYGHDHAAFELTVVCDGGWDYVVCKERMDELVTEAIIDLARNPNSV